MPLNDLETPFPVIDGDPHAKRVVSYMRPSDYAVWAAGTAAAPAAVYGLELADRTRLGPKGLAPTLKLATFIGFCGGFLLAYQNSSMRFWGWRENKREQARDLAELSELASQGKPLYGKSDLPEYVQGVAQRNSQWSQLKFSALPWFNLVNHNHHGVDTAKYKKSEESS